MHTTTNGLWLLPVQGSGARLANFFASAKATGMSTPGAVVVNNADYAANVDTYDELDLPEGWTMCICPATSVCEKLEQARAELCDGMAWIGYLQDNLVPVTQNWDALLLEAVDGWNVVSCSYGPRGMPTEIRGAVIWSGDLVGAVGYLCPPGLKSFFFEQAWVDLGKMMNIWTACPHVLVQPDKIAGIHPDWAHDEPIYGAWKNNQMLGAANRIGDLLIQYGVSKPLPSLSDVRLLIATPAGDGRYDGLYQTALFGTIALLRQCGATVNFSEMKFCSDITLARNKMFGTFLRSDATHMLSIDSDMGWNPQDAVRLLSHGKDYVAVAGPRKVFPPSFAAQNCDPNGHAMPLRQEAGSGLFEISHVGMAFALVTKSWAERMATAYADLEFSGDDGRTEYGVFNPMIVKRRYMSEDYAACERWRALGGKCFVDPTVSLQHVGTYVWSGDWLSHLQQTALAQPSAA